MRIVLLGIDLGKSSCSLVRLDESGAVGLRRRLRQGNVEKSVGGLSPCVVAMEACCGSHHLGCVFGGQGHEARLMSLEHVRAYVKAQENNDCDAEAAAEAATPPTMQFVPLKRVAQSEMRALHRAQEQLVALHTAMINLLRALLLERGIIAPEGRAKLEAELYIFADGETDSVSPRIQLLVEDLRREWRSLNKRIAAFDNEFVAFARHDEVALRLTTIPGVSTINATAMVAALGMPGLPGGATTWRPGSA